MYVVLAVYNVYIIITGSYSSQSHFLRILNQFFFVFYGRRIVVSKLIRVTYLTHGYRIYASRRIVQLKTRQFSVIFLARILLRFAPRSVHVIFAFRAIIVNDTAVCV